MLLFGDIKEQEGAHSKTQLIAERLHDLEAGRWSSVWAQVGVRPPGEDSPGPELARTVARVTELVEAHELSRAAAAVWPCS